MKKTLTFVAGTGMAVAAVVGLLKGIKDRCGSEATEGERSDPDKKGMCLGMAFRSGRRQHFSMHEPDAVKKIMDEFTPQTAKAYFHKLFRLFYKEDIREIFDDDETPDDMLVRTYTEQLADLVYDRLKASLHLEPAVKYEDKSGRGLFAMECYLFDCPAVCIYSDNEETYYDHCDLINDREIWMLADGHFAVVRSIQYDGHSESLVYRFVDHYIEFEEDLICDVQSLYENIAGWFGHEKDAGDGSC